MAKKPKRRHQKDRENYTGKNYARYALAIGQVALCWNHLHERLGQLFQTVMMLPHDRWHPRPEDDDDKQYNQWLVAHRHSRRMSKAAWSAINMDRPKREMLRAAVNSLPKWIANDDPNLKSEVLWILANVESLEEVRNNVIHSPLSSVYFTPPDGLEKIFEVPFPDTLSGNSRAMKLAQRDLISEYRYCRDMALALADYADEIMIALSGDTPWPEKPPLPTREPKRTRLSQHRQYALGRLSPQLRSWLLKPWIDD